jgi:hypothetical protein
MRLAVEIKGVEVASPDCAQGKLERGGKLERHRILTVCGKGKKGEGKMRLRDRPFWIKSVKSKRLQERRKGYIGRTRNGEIL